MWMLSCLTVRLRVRLAILVVGQCLLGGAIAGSLPSPADALEPTETTHPMVLSQADQDFASSCRDFSRQSRAPQQIKRVTVTQSDGEKYEVVQDKAGKADLRLPAANQRLNDLRFRSKINAIAPQLDNAEILSQEEINRELGRLLSPKSNEVLQVSWQEQVRKALDKLLLNKGYINLEFSLISTAKESSNEVTFTLSPTDQKITIKQVNVKQYTVKLDEVSVEVLTQDEIEEELNKLLNQELAMSSEVSWQEQVRRWLNQLLLKKGYITSEFRETDLERSSSEQTYDFSPGQLVEIQPWEIKSGRLNVVLERQNGTFIVKNTSSKVDQSNRTESGLIPTLRSPVALRAQESQPPQSGLSVDQSIAQIISLEKLRFGLNDKLAEYQPDKNESLDKKAEKVSETLKILLADREHPLVEVKVISKQERIETEREKGTLVLTLQLAWRQPISSSLQSYICRRIKLGVKNPVDASKVEDQLRLLRDDAAIGSIEGILKQSKIGQCPTEEFENKVRLIRNVVQSLNNDVDFFLERETIEKAGILLAEQKSCLEVRIAKAKPISVTANVDNYSPPSLGAIRAGIGFRYRNAVFLGSELGVGYSNSFTGGNQVISTDYRVPFNPLNGALSLRVSLTRNRITQDDLDFLNIRGKSQFYELEYRQPLLRTPRQEFALSAGFAVQQGQSLFLGRPAQLEIGADQKGNTRTSVVKLGLDYLQRSPSSVFFAKLQTVIGTGLFDATNNQGAIPDGQFVSVLGQLQWLKEKRNWIFDTDHIFIAQFEGQWSPDALLRTQQFVLGGGTSVRGYRQNAASGDMGFRLSLEDRIALWDRRRANSVREKQGYLPEDLDTNPKVDRGCQAPLQDLTWSLIPFFDMGLVSNQAGNARDLYSNRFFAGAGVGLEVGVRPLTNQICEQLWTLRIDYGVPLISARDGDRIFQDSGLYFTLRYRF